MLWLLGHASFGLALGTRARTIRVERLRHSTVPATLEALRPPMCVDEALDVMLGEHYRPVHTRSTVLGRCKFDDFKKIAEIGSGGYGTVVSAVHVPSNTTVAVKAVMEMNPAWHAWIRAEECIQFGLDFPFITKHHCTMVMDWYAWLVLELIEGDTLRKMLQNYNGSRHVLDPRKIAAQLVVSLEYLHMNNVVLGDMTPANVMIAAGSTDAKIIDFGFSRRVDPARPAGAPTWVERSLLPDFASNPYLDWFALGYVIYEMLAAMRPGVVCEPAVEETAASSQNWAADYRKPSPKVANCAWMSPNKLQREHRCERLLGTVECDLISKLIGNTSEHNWRDTWGLSAESRASLKAHAWFAGFDWDGLEQKVAGKMVVNPYNA